MWPSARLPRPYNIKTAKSSVTLPGFRCTLLSCRTSLGVLREIVEEVKYFDTPRKNVDIPWNVTGYLCPAVDLAWIIPVCYKLPFSFSLPPSVVVVVLLLHMCRFLGIWKTILGVPPLKKVWKNWYRYSPSVWFLDKKNSFLWNYLPNAFMGHCTSTFTVKTNPEHPGPLISESDPEPFPFSSSPHNLGPCEYYAISSTPSLS
jgi:hypothetical protein